MTEELKRKKRSLFSVVVLLVSVNVLSISILLSAFEIYLRYTATYVTSRKPEPIIGALGRMPMPLFTNTPKGKRFIPNSHVVIVNHFLSHYDVQMDINSLGMRDDEIKIIKPDNHVRILALGDSITGADYLQCNDVYVKRIEYYLNQAASGKTKVFEVINDGVGDIGMKEEVSILQENGLVVDPDIVMVGFYLNDSRPPWGFQGELGAPGFIRRHSLLAENIYKWLVLGKWLKESGRGRLADWAKAAPTLDWKNDRNAFMKLVFLADLDWGAAWKDDSWVSLDPEFGKLKELSNAYGFKVMFVIFPVSFQVYADFVEDEPQRKLEEVTRKFGFYYFDLLPYLRDRKNEDLFFDWCHPRVWTNDMIGKDIAEYLEKNVLTDVFVTSPEESKH